MKDNRLKCPFCNHLREGFALADAPVNRKWFPIVEIVYIKFQCLNCKKEFRARYSFSGEFIKEED